MDLNRIEFFHKIESKYNIQLNRNRPFVVRLDGRHITGNKQINLLDDSEGTFTYALKMACKRMSANFLIYMATDEVNIIVLDSAAYIKTLKHNYAQEATACIAQEFSYIFHQYYTKGFVMFAGRAFSLYKDNVYSYLIYRKHSNTNVLLNYYLKRELGMNISKGVSFKEYEELANEREGFRNRTALQKEGIAFYKGFEFQIEEILTNNLNELVKQRKQEIQVAPSNPNLKNASNEDKSNKLVVEKKKKTPSEVPKKPHIWMHPKPKDANLINDNVIIDEDV